MKTTIRLLIRTFILFLFAFISCQNAFSQQAEPTKKTLKSVVTDTKGSKYNVSPLYAKYSAGGMWLGTRPTDVVDKISIILETSVTEDRVTTTSTETIELNFITIKRIVFQGASIPQEYKPIFLDRIVLYAEMRDGSIVILGNGNYLRKNINEKQVLQKYTHYIFCTGKTQGVNITLDGFSGSAKNRSGVEGDFWISLTETKEITFEL
jgi:hypothetical protein